MGLRTWILMRKDSSVCVHFVRDAEALFGCVFDEDRYRMA